MSRWPWVMVLFALAACAPAPSHADPRSDRDPVQNGRQWIFSNDGAMGPRLTLVESPAHADHNVVLLLSCAPLAFHVDARTYQPAQAFPQPPLVLELGNLSRTQVPTATALSPPDYSSLKVNYEDAGELVRAIGTSKDMSLVFLGNSQKFDLPSQALRNRFVEECLAGP